MDYSKATNDQLIAIYSEDIDCPTHLLSGAVKEALNRGLFNKLIYYIFDNKIGNWKQAVRAWNTENEDLLSMGYCGVLTALRGWKQGKSSFKHLACMCIKSEFTHALDKENTQRRQIYKVTESYDKPGSNGYDDLKYLFPSTQNVEKEAIRHIEFETILKRLSSREKEVLTYFLEGYSVDYIAFNIFQHKSSTTIYRNFRRALEKIGLGDFKLRELKTA